MTRGKNIEQGDTVIRIPPGAWRRFAAASLKLFTSAVLASCGSGGVTDNTAVNSGPLSITPSAATLYSDLPTTFLVSGGTGSYAIISSNQNVVPVASTLKGGSFIVVPNQVAADTAVTITVRDAGDGSVAPATASLTVKPRTVSNVVTVTPSASQSAACGTSICSGGDAEVRVTLSRGDLPLAGREVRFDVVSGDLRIITSAPGANEVDALSGTATTDSAGTARIRVRVLPDATAQTAILRITDVDSGSTQQASVTIAPASNAPLNAQPQTIQFTGPDANTCSTGVRADVIIFGGRPPYQVTQPSGFAVSPTVVTSSGGHVSVTSTSACARTATTSTPEGGQTMAIVDANGATVSVLIHNDPAPSSVVSTPFTLGPAAVTLDSCTAIANIALVGGSGSYVAASGSNLLTATIVSGSMGRIQRTKDTGPTTLTTIPVAFSDGQTTKEVVVTLAGNAQSTSCP